MTVRSPYAPSLNSGRRLWRLLLIFLLLLIVIWLAVRVVRTASAARSVLVELEALQALDLGAMATLDPAILADMQRRFGRLEANLDTIASQTGPFLPLTRALGWLPRFGADAQAAPELLQLAQGVATAGRASMEGAHVLALALHDETGERSALARLVSALEQSQPSWLEAEQALAQVAAARSQLDLSRLDARVSSQLQRLDNYLPLLQTGSALARLAPALLGAEGAKRYLVLVQNSDELRPTGGFISGVGLLQVEDGQLGEMAFEDSYNVYNPNVDHPLAPSDLEQTMGAQILLFRDANWAADFPTSARVAQSLYQLDMGIATDGVVAFDLEAVRRLMAAFEPLAVPGYEQPLTSGNLVDAIIQMWAEPVTAEGTVQEAYTSDWWLHRKDFMGEITAAALASLEAGQADLAKLGQALYSSMEEKHVLVTVDDAAAQALLAEAGWNGAVDPRSGDFLMVVDTNIGWNKVNRIVERSTSYTITPRADGSAQVELALDYRHLGEATDEPCVHAGIAYEGSYADLVHRCYFNYLRVLAPAGAQLISTQGFEADSTSVRPGERGTTQLAGRVVVPPGATRLVKLSYDLPAGLVDGDSYALRVQKQPGTPPWPVEVLLVDPDHQWTPMAPNGKRDEQGVRVSFSLSHDTDIVMTRRP